MRKPEPPLNEHERLRALASYEVLDTPPESTFDALTTIAAQIVNTPVALVSLVDAGRQWFKSRHGLEVESTPRDVSFCGHVVQEGGALVVVDALADQRFADNPLVAGELGIRFYAGMPLRDSEGFVLGTLCAIDFKPRQITADQRKALELLAQQVVALLELRRSTRLLQQERSLLLARDQELRESQEQLRALFEGMQEGVTLQDSDSKIIAANSAAFEILGLTKDQLEGRTSLDPSWRCVHEDGSPFPGETHPSLVSLQTGRPVTNVIMGVHSSTRPLAWISINARPLWKENATRPHAVIVTFRDITDERNAADLAARLATQERLVTTGTLAAGIGHEINSPLTYVISNIDFAQEELRGMTDGSSSVNMGRLRELVDVITEAREGAERVRRIVRGLKSLARAAEPPQPTDLRNVIEMAMNLSMHELRPKATVLVSPISVPAVLADESRLTQVLVNLLVNAAQAFPQSDPTCNRVEINVVPSASHVAIEVADNGPGIAPEVLPRIFDPFFTTKPVGNGTGLGLSISHSIVTSLDGELTCVTQLGMGTTFRVVLPLPKTQPPVRPADAMQPSTPRGKVLVVDDDVSVLRSVSRLLMGENDVVTISDPREAYQVLQSGQRFDVVFCDLMMPHMTGVELLRLVSQTIPGMAERFVLITGGVVREDMQEFLAGISNERLEKPFSTRQIRGVVRRFVSAGPAEGQPPQVMVTHSR